MTPSNGNNGAWKDWALRGSGILLLAVIGWLYASLSPIISSYSDIKAEVARLSERIVGLEQRLTTGIASRFTRGDADRELGDLRRRVEKLEQK